MFKKLIMNVFMDQNEIKLKKIIRVLFFIMMTFSCIFGIISTKYFDVYISILFFLPPIISFAYLFYSSKRYGLKLFQTSDSFQNNINLKLSLLINFILGFSVLPVSNLLFSESITTKTLYLSLILGLIFLSIPFMGRHRGAIAKN